MPLVEEIISGRYSIQAYTSGAVTINDQVYRQSLLLSAAAIVHPWPVNSVIALVDEHLHAIVDLQPDVVLLGTGDAQSFPDVAIMGFFAARGIGLEVMNNGALCRTFNILVAEDRQVVAAIIQPDA